MARSTELSNWANIQAQLTSPCAKNVAQKIVIGAVALFVGVKVIGAIQAARSKSRVQALNATNKPNVVYVHLAPPCDVAPSFGAPACKVVSFLRIHKIPHVLRYGMDNSGSPNGLMPYVVLNGTATSESEVIIETIAAAFKVDLSAGLNKEQVATGRLVRLAFDDSARFHVSRQMMVDHPDYMCQLFAKLVGKPLWMVKIVLRQYRKMTIETLDRQGCGMLSDARYQHELVETLKALETTIGSKKFLLTDEAVTQYDAAVWSNLITWVFVAEINTPATQFVRGSKILTTYLKNVGTAIYGDSVSAYVTDFQQGKDVQIFA